MTSSGDQNRREQISILGSGWLGLPLAQELQQAGYKVVTSTRKSERLEHIKNLGISACLYDIESIENDHKFLQADILIINITSKDISAHQALIKQIEISTIKKVLFISSTSVYADSEYSNLTPTIEADKSALKPCSLLDIENLFLAQKNFETSIIRFAGLIGYQRHPGRFFIQQDEHNELHCKTIRNPDGFVNMIHRDDCIGIIRALIKQQSWGQIFNGCSSHHPTRRKFYSWAIADYCGTNKLVLNFSEDEKSSFKIIDNNKVKNHLAYQFSRDDLLSLTFSEKLSLAD